jgi:hypothetical protein
MLGWFWCLIGRHDWEHWDTTRWGETINYRKCKRQGCRVRQRWHRNHYENKDDKTGYWA